MMSPSLSPSPNGDYGQQDKKDSKAFECQAPSLSNGNPIHVQGKELVWHAAVLEYT